MNLSCRNGITSCWFQPTLLSQNSTKLSWLQMQFTLLIMLTSTTCRSSGASNVPVLRWPQPLTEQNLHLNGWKKIWAPFHLVLESFHQPSIYVKTLVCQVDALYRMVNSRSNTFVFNRSNFQKGNITNFCSPKIALYRIGLDHLFHDFLTDRKDVW